MLPDEEILKLHRAGLSLLKTACMDGSQISAIRERLPQLGVEPHRRIVEIEKLKKLKAEGLKIQQIAERTGWARKSVGTTLAKIKRGKK